MINFFGIDGRISIRQYILNVTLVNRIMWNEVWWKWHLVDVQNWYIEVCSKNCLIDYMY